MNMIQANLWTKKDRTIYINPAAISVIATNAGNHPRAHRVFFMPGCAPGFAIFEAGGHAWLDIDPLTATEMDKISNG